MKMVVGLGNPGRKYEGTRHNVGFAVVREVARRHAVGKSKTSFQAEVMEVALPETENSRRSGKAKSFAAASANVHEPER